MPLIMSEPCQVDILRVWQGSSPDNDEMTSWVCIALQKFVSVAEVSVCIVSSADMTQLNSRYRNKNQVTNVLSFPSDLHPGTDSALLGDIVLCGPEIISQARQQGKKVKCHWAHLLIHGTLHLLGFNHDNNDKECVMEGIEIQCLAELSMPNPYEL